MTDPLPARVLPHLLWSFGHTHHATREALSEAIRRYQYDITGEDKWRPDEPVLPIPRATIQFHCWTEREEIEPRFEVTSASPEGFTALDLIFQVFTGITRALEKHHARLGDHHFFEGLRLGRPGPVPLYHVRFGS